MMSYVESSLHRAANSTFEELGFMLPDRELNRVQSEAEVDAEVSVVFRGPFEGYLVLRMCGGTLGMVAMNMLGESEAPAEALQLDALGELANVICGNLLPAIAGSREIFRLDPPQPGIPGLATAPAGSELVSSALIGLDDGRAELALYATEAIGAAGGAA
jgi:CheY-specific phosphatase CheX